VGEFGSKEDEPVMKISLFGSLAAGVAALTAFSVSQADASVVAYSNEAAFLADTGATNAMPLGFPNLGLATPASLPVGSVTFRSPPPSSVVSGNLGLAIADWSSLLPGFDLAISGVEDLDIIANAPVYAMGGRAAEPSTPGDATDTCATTPCVDSTFSVTLMNGATFVDSFTFNLPNNVAAFFGVSSTTPFDRLLIRETTGTDDNEYFGTVFTSSLAPVVVPEPMPLTLLGIGLLGLGFVGRRKKL
jgi:hypothetical protein